MKQWTDFIKRLLPLCFIHLPLLMVGSAGVVHAQDVQPGHYAPGWNASLRAGAMPADPGFYVLSTTMFYNARKFKDGSGNTVSNDETDYVLQAFALAWRPDFKLLGADYQATVTPAVGNLSSLPVLVNDELQDPPVGLADVFFSPVALGWHWEEFRLTAALGGFAPTGRYSFGDNDNTGLGFWTVIPYVVGSYRSDKGVFENMPLLAMGALRYEVHSNQKGRDFRPGDSFTFEWGLGLEVAERTDVGIHGFLYRQVTDAKGSDAKPVDKYRANGIGASLNHGIGPVNLGLRLYQDFGVENGPKGTLVYLEIGWGWPRKAKS